MHDRDALGPADVSDATLTAMVETLVGADHGPISTLTSSYAEAVGYDLPALTTGGRWWVRGQYAARDRTGAFTFFVKQVHSWSRSPLFAELPDEIKPWAAEQVPWRTEGAVYRSDLGDHLPDGLAMPRALGVHDIDDLSYAVWLEEVPAVPAAWDRARYLDAARLLGRFAASPAVRERSAVGGHEWDISRYVEGRLAMQVLPALADDGVWRHPLVAPSFGALRGRLEDAAARVRALAEELMALPVLAGHGDACPNNLLVRPDRAGFTLIDFGFFNPLPIGFDLGQLLVGEAQLGRGSVADLADRGEACVAAYVDGLAAEGVVLDPAVVRRAHALHLLLFTGLSSLPLEWLAEEPTDDRRAMATARAAITRHVLDLLDQTG